MTFIHLSEAELAKEGIVKLADFPFAKWLLSTPPASPSQSPSERPKNGSPYAGVPLSGLPAAVYARKNS